MAISVSKFVQLRGVIALYARRGVTAATTPTAWDSLWDEVARAYRAGLLSDNEHDTLLSQIHAAN